MEKLFVSEEIAKLLKVKGFNKKCFAYYTNNTLCSSYL